jgi:uncharacterized protein
MSGLAPVEVRSRLEPALRAAMKAKDTVAVRALRSVLAAIANAEAVPMSTTSATVAQSQHVAGGTAGLASAEAARRELTADETAGVVRDEILERETAARQYANAGHTDRAARLLCEAQAIRVALGDGGSG